MSKFGSTGERRDHEEKLFATGWNDLEAGVLFGLHLPLLVFHERGVAGGIFDNGVSDHKPHPMPYEESDELHDLFSGWQAQVRAVH